MDVGVAQTEYVLSDIGKTVVWSGLGQRDLDVIVRAEVSTPKGTQPIADHRRTPLPSVDL